MSKDWLDKHFIRPILEEYPGNMNLSDYLEQVLSLKERPISVYRCIKGFDLGGVYLEQGVHPIPGYNKAHRYVKKNSLLVVRKDHEDVFFSIEYAGAVYKLGREAWNDARRNLVVKAGNDELT